MYVCLRVLRVVQRMYAFMCAYACVHLYILQRIGTVHVCVLVFFFHVYILLYLCMYMHVCLCVCVKWSIIVILA
jgi:hypothetical protein